MGPVNPEGCLANHELMAALLVIRELTNRELGDLCAHTEDKAEYIMTCMDEALCVNPDRIVLSVFQSNGKEVLVVGGWTEPYDICVSCGSKLTEDEAIEFLANRFLCDGHAIEAVYMHEWVISDDFLSYLRDNAGVRVASTEGVRTPVLAGLTVKRFWDAWVGGLEIERSGNSVVWNVGRGGSCG